MNIVHQCSRRWRSATARLQGAARLLLGTALLSGLCVLIADPQAPARLLAAAADLFFAPPGAVLSQGA